MLPMLDDPNTRDRTTTCALNVILSYFDPRILLLLIPITVIQTRYQVHNSPFDTSNIRPQSAAKSEFIMRLGITSLLCYLVHICSPSQIQWTNTKNILLAKDPNENLGLYWYLLSEMFKDRILFFRYALVLMQLAMSLFVSQMLWNLADMLDWTVEQQSSNEEGNKLDTNKAQRRRQRAYMVGFLLLAFVKLIMNPYPTLHDLSILSFLILMNMTLVLSKVEAFVFICCGILYGIINTWLLLITWLHRFSGNANFFFFQIIVLDAFIVILFIQVFMAVDTKRKKYANELLCEADKKKPK